LVDLRVVLSEGAVSLPRTGQVRAGIRDSLPYVVMDGPGVEVEPVSQYLRDLALSDRSPLTCRSYAHDLRRSSDCLRSCA
jgi:hypothetical protein